MLVSGIIVAIAGILLFSFTLVDPKEFTDVNGKLEWKLYLVHSIRPALMLFFVEFIAIYLLRQYRTLIQDYKYFHAIYLMRLDNFLIYRLLKNEDMDDDQKEELVDIMNNRSESLNWIAFNDRVTTGNDLKELNNGLSNVSDLIKILRGK